MRDIKRARTLARLLDKEERYFLSCLLAVLRVCKHLSLTAYGAVATARAFFEPRWCSDGNEASPS